MKIDTEGRRGVGTECVGVFADFDYKSFLFSFE